VIVASCGSPCSCGASSASDEDTPRLRGGGPDGGPGGSTRAVRDVEGGCSGYTLAPVCELWTEAGPGSGGTFDAAWEVEGGNGSGCTVELFLAAPNSVSVGPTSFGAAAAAPPAPKTSERICVGGKGPYGGGSSGTSPQHPGLFRNFLAARASTGTICEPLVERTNSPDSTGRTTRGGCSYQGAS
jgi:hypothetical protein